MTCDSRGLFSSFNRRLLVLMTQYDESDPGVGGPVRRSGAKSRSEARAWVWAVAPAPPFSDYEPRHLTEAQEATTVPLVALLITTHPVS